MAAVTACFYSEYETDENLMFDLMYCADEYHQEFLYRLLLDHYGERLAWRRKHYEFIYESLTEFDLEPLYGGLSGGQ